MNENGANNFTTLFFLIKMECNGSIIVRFYEFSFSEHLIFSAMVILNRDDPGLIQNLLKVWWNTLLHSKIWKFFYIFCSRPKDVFYSILDLYTKYLFLHESLHALSFHPSQICSLNVLFYSKTSLKHFKY